MGYAEDIGRGDELAAVPKRHGRRKGLHVHPQRQHENPHPENPVDYSGIRHWQ